MDAWAQHVVEMVDRHGWMVQRVVPQAGERPELFAYTTGLSVTFDWPEMICFGLDEMTMHAMLNGVVEACRKRGEIPHADMFIDDIIEDFPLKLVKAGPWVWSYVPWAMWLSDRLKAPHSTLRCLQLVYPDSLGRFPDDPACEQEARELQTPLVKAN